MINHENCHKCVKNVCEGCVKEVVNFLEGSLDRKKLNTNNVLLKRKRSYYIKKNAPNCYRNRDCLKEMILFLVKQCSWILDLLLTVFVLFNIAKKICMLIAADTRHIIVRTEIQHVNSILTLDNALARCYSRPKFLYLFRG